MDSDDPIKLLLIEDERGQTRLMLELLKDAPGPDIEPTAVTSLHDALEALARNDFDVGVVDLNLPDSEGLDTFLTIRQTYPDVPVVILTGIDDSAMARQALEGGAEDYLTKLSTLEPESVHRAVQHAIIRHTLARQQAQHAKQLEETLAALQDYAKPAAAVSATAASFQIRPLRDARPALFEEIADQYQSVLTRAIQEAVYSMRHSRSPALESLAERLGRNRAGPQDVVELHYMLGRRLTQGLDPAKAHHVLDVTSSCLIELMGHLAAYYRRHAWHSASGDYEAPEDRARHADTTRSDAGPELGREEPPTANLSPRTEATP